MPIRALDLNKVHKFTSKYDDPEDPTVWELGTLSSSDMGRIQDAATDISFKTVPGEEGQDISTKINTTKRNFEVLRRSLKGWSNFVGPDDKMVEFKTHQREIDGKQREVPRPELLELIPLKVVSEIAEFVLAEHTAEDDEVKN